MVAWRVDQLVVMMAVLKAAPKVEMMAVVMAALMVGM